MSPKSKEEYTVIISKRYKRAKFSSKSSILDEYCAVTGLHRKSAIRKLNNFKLFQKKKRSKPGPKSIYNKKEILTPLRTIWLKSNLLCSKNLKPAIVIWVPSFEQSFYPLEQNIKNTLLKISPATIDRILKPIRPKYKTKGRSCTKPGTLLRKHIPIATNQWTVDRPGFIEADTVHHCAESTVGQYVLTVDFVDIFSGWTEQRAIFGKGETATREQVQDVENSLPFKILGFDSDNGSEFLNYTLLKYFTNRSNPIEFTRSRAYHKNDNAHIEQKNWTKVREWIGYQRFEDQRAVALLNDLYKNEFNLLNNFFLPSVKLIAKERIGSKIIKKHDKPLTPYQRLLNSKHIDQLTKNQLTRTFESLNAFELRKMIDRKLKKIFKFALPGNIYSDSSIPSNSPPG